MTSPGVAHEVFGETFSYPVTSENDHRQRFRFVFARCFHRPRTDIMTLIRLRTRASFQINWTAIIICLRIENQKSDRYPKSLVSLDDCFFSIHDYFPTIFDHVILPFLSERFPTKQTFYGNLRFSIPFSSLRTKNTSNNQRRRH